MSCHNELFQFVVYLPVDPSILAPAAQQWTVEQLVHAAALVRLTVGVVQLVWTAARVTHRLWRWRRQNELCALGHRWRTNPRATRALWYRAAKLVTSVVSAGRRTASRRMTHR